MELKDVILSTLAEMEEPVSGQVQTFNIEKTSKILVDEKELPVLVEEEKEAEIQSSYADSELIYLNSIRERLLVLFEGFQAPNNTNIEAKLDLTLNFLEYTLATIDARVEKLEKGNR
jgi:hypothetical protein